MSNVKTNLKIRSKALVINNEMQDESNIPL